MAASVIQVFGLPLYTIEPIPNDLISAVFGGDTGTIQDVPENIITISNEDVQQIQEMPQVDYIITNPAGPPGAPGQDGAAGEAVVVREAAQALGGHRVVKPVASDEVDYASSDIAGDGDLILGITKGAAAAGDDVQVQVGGTMTEGSWNWILGPVYCGLNGVLTQVVPTSGFVCRVAKALSPTTILVNVEEAFLLAS